MYIGTLMEYLEVIFSNTFAAVEKNEHSSINNHHNVQSTNKKLKVMSFSNCDISYCDI